MYKRKIFIFLYIQLLGVSLQQLLVERKISSHCHGFCSSTDYFTNTDKTNSFCSSRNASCVRNCNDCKCFGSHTFVSYKHGCKSIHQLENLLNATFCLESTDFYMEVPTTSDKTLSYDSCEQLTSKPNQKLVQYCKIQDAFEIEPAFMNTERLLAHPFQIRQTSFIQCLKCQNFICSLSNWAGMLIKLVLNCENYKYPYGPVSSCFIFKVNGIRNVTAIVAPVTTTTTTSTTEKNTTVVSMKKEEEKINTTTIMIIVILVSLCLVVLVVLSIVLLRYRKKKLIRRKSQCAHYLTKASSGEENVYAEMGNHAYEDTDESGTILRYARPDNNELSEQNPSESKMEENAYYKTADINGNDKELANALYGMEPNHEREHIYAESNVTQNIIPEAQPEYAYTSNVFDDMVKDVSYQYAEVKTKKKDKQNNLRPENMFTKKISGYDEVGSVMDPE